MARMSEDSTCSWPAPAKINLFLHVLGRRQDGYHDIQTLFQLLDWGDEVHIHPASGPLISRLPVTYGVPESEDLVVKAARLLQYETGCRRGAEIGVNKRIPPGSGMGGGSSDAATVLLVLNRLWGCGLDLDELASLGASLGADVPVFVQGRSAMAEGIGERLEPVSLGSRHYILVFPAFSVSTRAVFSDAMLARDSKLISLSEALTGEGRNDCEVVVRRRFPALARMLEALEEWGHPVMTGTGSGIFIPMRDEKSAKSAAKEMKTLYNVRAVRGMDRSPLHERLDGCWF
jgi:4-diphosphocytidyl-2-C-methyl-D-erythritol kinase